MSTRTLSVPVEDFEDYVEWLASQAWPVVAIYATACGRYIVTTFAVRN